MLLIYYGNPCAVQGSKVMHTKSLLTLVQSVSPIAAGLIGLGVIGSRKANLKFVANFALSPAYDGIGDTARRHSARNAIHRTGGHDRWTR